MHRWSSTSVVLLTLALLLASAVPAAAAPNDNSRKLRTAVTVHGILEHEEAFQSFADAGGDNRTTTPTRHMLTKLGGSVSIPAFDSSAGRIAVVGDPQGGTFSVIAPQQAVD